MLILVCDSRSTVAGGGWALFSTVATHLLSKVGDEEKPLKYGALYHLTKLTSDVSINDKSFSRGDIVNGLWTMTVWINGIYDRGDVGIANLSAQRLSCWSIIAELMKYDYSHLPEVRY